MRKILSTCAALTVSILALAGCSPSASNSDSAETDTATPTASIAEATFPVTVAHESGETTLEAQPQRIVVLDMAVLDTLNAIGAGKQVVGTVTKSVPEWLKGGDVDYTTLENAGSLKEPDMEAIAKMNPDLIIVAGRSAKLYEEFAGHYPTINASTPWDRDHYSHRVIDTVKMLGQATGHISEAEAAAKTIEDTINKYAGMAKDKGTAMVLMSNAGEISMHGPKSRWAPIYDVFGFKPVDTGEKSDEGHKGQKISFETVADINPDYIFVVDRDAAVGKVEAGVTAKEVLDNDLVNSTTAAKNGHIVYLDPQRWYIVMTGATNYVSELDEVAAALK